MKSTPCSMNSSMLFCALGVQTLTFSPSASACPIHSGRLHLVGVVDTLKTGRCGLVGGGLVAAEAAAIGAGSSFIASRPGSTDRAMTTTRS